MTSSVWEVVFLKLQHTLEEVEFWLSGPRPVHAHGHCGIVLHFVYHYWKTTSKHKPSILTPLYISRMLPCGPGTDLARNWFRAEKAQFSQNAVFRETLGFPPQMNWPLDVTLLKLTTYVAYHCVCNCINPYFAFL
jgi:hypothetical protein